MRYLLLASIFLTTIILSNLVLADYTFYPQQGNNQKYSGAFTGTLSNTYTVTKITDAKAAITEPLIFDIDGDGKQEIFLQQFGGTIGAYSGSQPGLLNSTIGGTLANQPVTCDINGDGKLEYVAIIEETGSYALIAANYQNGRFRIFASQPVTPVHNQSNLVCGAFYENQGDNAFYAMWVDDVKTLNLWKANGGTFTGNNFSVGDSVARDAEYNNSGVYPLGSHNIVYSASMDTDGDGMVMFYAGNNAYAYFGDGTSAAVNISPLADVAGLNRYFPSRGVVNTYGNINSGGGSIVFHFGMDTGGVTDGAKAYYAVVQPSTSGFLGTKTLSKNSFSIAPSLVTIFQPWSRNKALNSFGIKRSGSFSDNLFTVMYQQGIDKIERSEINIVESTLTGSIVSQNIFDVPHTGGISNTDLGGGIFFADVDGDNINDLITMQGKLTYMTLSYLKGSENYTVLYPIANFSNTENLEQTVPVTVDFNNDGSPDFILSGAIDGETYFISSSGSQGMLNPPLAFSVNLVSSGDNKATSIVRSSEDLGVYYYGVACNLEQTPVFSEQLTTGYNATMRNATIGMTDGSYRLDFEGLTYTIPSQTEGFYYSKDNQNGFFDYATLYVDLKSNDDFLSNVLVYGTADFQTHWLQLNKTGNNLSVYKKLIAQPPVYLGSGTLATNEILLTVSYNPITDYVRRITYFNVTIQINNQTSIFTDTIDYPVSTIKEVLFTSQTVNATISLKSISVYRGNNVLVPQTRFRNGVNQIIGGVPVTSGSNITYVTGYGYSVITGFNTEFYAVCEYPSAGVYTQRHYLNRQNDFLDYANFVDVRVNVLSSPLGDVQNAPNTDSLEAGIASIAGSLGLKSVGGKMFFWVVLTMIFVIGLFTVHWLLGLSSFVILTLLGAVLGFIPLWVILIFVIMCAGIAAVGYRVMVSGQ